MKIDIEGHEIPTLMAGNKFWQEFNIPLILMEWQWVPLKFNEGTISQQTVLNFMAFMPNMRYQPFVNGNPLNKDAWLSWPNDIVWKKV